MRAPFSRPFFAWFFYGYSLLTTVLGLLLCLVYPAFVRGIVGGDLGIPLAGLAVVLAGVTVIQGIVTAAIGYGIELLAKIEWNTRPNIDAMGHVIQPTSAPSPHATLSGKQYYLREKGRDRGPFNGPEVLALYREGKVSFATTIYLEENGNRRALRNLSEINP